MFHLASFIFVVDLHFGRLPLIDASLTGTYFSFSSAFLLPRLANTPLAIFELFNPLSSCSIISWEIILFISPSWLYFAANLFFTYYT